VLQICEHELKPVKYTSEMSETEKMVCTIDLGGYCEGELVVVTPCQHVFHPRCLAEWLQADHMEKKCPNCNRDLTGYGIRMEESMSLVKADS
jgi:hypothetical protein